MLGTPIAASFLDLIEDTTNWEYSYDPKVRFLCFDFDIKEEHKDNPEYLAAIWNAVEYIYARLEERGIFPALTHSASKGYHLFVFLDAAVDLGYTVGVFKDIVSGVAGFYENGTKYILSDDNNKVVAEIDSLFKTGDGAVVKMPFSMHQKRTGYHELPIAIENLRTYRCTEATTTDNFLDAISVFDSWKITPAEFITKGFTNESDFIRPGRPKSRTSQSKTYKLKVINDDDPEILAGVKQLEEWMNPRSRKFLPCWKNSVDWSISKRVPFHLRTVIARLCTERGLSKEVGGAFIRKHINDEDDNLHPEKMDFHLNYWPDNFGHIVRKCENLQRKSSPIFCCTEPCGRKTPLDEYPRITGEKLLDAPPVIAGKSLEDYLNELLGGKFRHLQVFKGTRVGGTSGIVKFVMEQNGRICIICPTTKIAETIEEALRLASNGHLKIGALLPRNTEACLKAKLKVEQARDDFAADDSPALEKLPMCFRYDCSSCKYNQSYLPLTPGTVLKESDSLNYLCLYRTIVDHLQELDVLVLTHKKVYALTQAAKSAEDNPFIDGATDADFILGWISNSDFVLLDEISMMIDQPDLDLPLRTEPAGPEKKSFDILDVLQEETRLLSRLRQDDTFFEIQEIVDGLIEEFKSHFNATGITVYEREVTPEESEAITKCLKRIQTFAVISNIALTDLFKALMSSVESTWVVVQEPDPDNELCIKVYTLPKFKHGVSEFLAGSKCRLIAMDATMPLTAARDLDKIMGVHFNRINIGDPNKASDKQKIVCWPNSIIAPQLTDPIERSALKSKNNFTLEDPKDMTELSWIDREILNTMKMMDQLWGIENCIIAVPSKLAAKKVKTVTAGHIDRKKLEIMWHRGSESIGVKNEKRVMIGLTAPYAPKGSNHWVKEILHPDILADIEHDTIWEYDRNKTEYQTASRAKAPNFNGEGERSVYIAFGQPINEVEAMRSTNICPPTAIEVYGSRGFHQRHIAPVLTAWFWTAHGIELTDAEQAAMVRVWDGEMDPRTVQRSVTPLLINVNRVRHLTNLLEPHLFLRKVN